MIPDFTKYPEYDLLKSIPQEIDAAFDKALELVTDKVMRNYTFGSIRDTVKDILQNGEPHNAVIIIGDNAYACDNSRMIRTTRDKVKYLPTSSDALMTLNRFKYVQKDKYMPCPLPSRRDLVRSIVANTAADCTPCYCLGSNLPTVNARHYLSMMDAFPGVRPRAYDTSFVYFEHDGDLGILAALD